MQDQLIPSGYVSSKPLLQSNRALPEPDLTTPVVQSRADARTRGADCGTARSGTRGVGCGAVRGAVQGAVQGAARGATHSISHGIFRSDLQADKARVSDVQRRVSVRAISCSPQVSNQRSESFIMTPHALPDVASSASRLFDDDGSDGVDGEIDGDGMGVDEDVDQDEMGLNVDDIGFEEEDIEEDGVGDEEDHIGVEEDDIGVEENGNNDMDYDNYRNDDLMYASDHNDWANSGNHQVRHSATRVPDPGADEEVDNTTAARIDRNQQNR